MKKAVLFANAFTTLAAIFEYGDGVEQAQAPAA